MSEMGANADFAPKNLDALPGMSELYRADMQCLFARSVDMRAGALTIAQQYLSAWQSPPLS